MPLRDDLIERTLEQLAELLGGVLEHHDEAALAAAEALIEEAYARHAGGSGRLLRLLGSEELLAVLSTAGRLDGERACAVAALLDAEAEVLRRRGAPQPELRCKALDLYLAAASHGFEAPETPADEALEARVQALEASLAGYALPAATLWRLFDHRLARGGFAGAEDLLFEALERFRDDPELDGRGRAFYRQLAREDDARLARGGLPRDEVEEGRAAFERALARPASDAGR